MNSAHIIDTCNEIRDNLLYSDEYKMKLNEMHIKIASIGYMSYQHFKNIDSMPSFELIENELELNAWLSVSKMIITYINSKKLSENMTEDELNNEIISIATMSYIVYHTMFNLNIEDYDLLPFEDNTQEEIHIWICVGQSIKIYFNLIK